MKQQRYLSVLTAALLALGSVSAFAAAGGNGGGHGAGGSGGNAGGMSGGHMSGQALSNSNGMHAADRDKGLARAADRSDMIADRAGTQPGRDHTHAHGHTAHASTSTHHSHRNAFGRTL
ncbi:hypothetical protein QZM97_24530 [Burkholderia orbicola]|uniref:Uncharacterized protein n=3 Tax=Burkholderia cepacia complex TaxID=87882 RepID=A0A3R9DCN3_9BURK|nr:MULTISPECIES: hypothetical protein [Burkholderia cepacia complex]EKS9842372.1 hypothetical protein [Burkholderia cepacia]ABK06780.1 conserved hypothetical protein [Burkholderia cenocepacia HI2424]AQT48657.1 hypothetical protein BHQ31_00685 [Burkholderia cenocepacia]MBJ9669329.1 hypothetical protein [Burkholderia cenocepacia]MBJ9879544.1 hypothetical protein [Burkholderia cenocepacia]